ncbi:hypothetical protein MTO96_039926 [Rhipicephalus appendiculatus]
MDSTTTVYKSGPTIQMHRLFIIVMLASFFTTILFLRWTAGGRAPIHPSGNDSGKLAPIQRSRTPPALRRRFNAKWYNDSLFKESTANKANDIWFLETSGRRQLKAREACSIESACRHNTNYTVHLLYTGSISSTHCPYHRALSELPNFRSTAINASTVLAGTPLSRFYEKGGALHRSRFFVEHLSDFLRYAVVWKHGGIYLDSDTIVLKSLEDIKNSVVFRGHGRGVANSLLFFTRNHPVIGAIMDACSRRYSPKVWTSCGPALTSQLPLDPVFSRRVNFLGAWTFFRFFYTKWRIYFDPKMAEQVLKAGKRKLRRPLLE